MVHLMVDLMLHCKVHLIVVYLMLDLNERLKSFLRKQLKMHDKVTKRM